MERTAVIVTAACCLFFACNQSTVTPPLTGPAVSFVSGNLVANETAVEKYSSTEVMLIASMTTAVDSEITVYFSVSGSADSGADFSVSKNRFVFTPGTTLCTTMVVLKKDTMVESSETAVFTLIAPAGARLGACATATVVIADMPVVNMEIDEKTVSRRSGRFVVTARLTQHSATEVKVPFTVSGTAKYPAAHDLTEGVLLFPAGDTVSTKVVTVINDSLEHEFKDIIISLGLPTDALRGEDSTTRIIIAYDPVVSYQLLDNEFTGWTQSPYASGFRVVSGEDFFTVINGGAQIFIENNYTVALVQNLVAGDTRELNIMAIKFGTAVSVDSVFTAKTKNPDLPPADVVITGFDAATAVGYYSIEAITVFARFGTTYFELVVKGFSEDRQLLDVAQQVLDTLKSRVY